MSRRRRRFETDPAFQKAIRKIYRNPNNLAVLDSLIGDVAGNFQSQEMRKHIAQARLGLSEKAGRERLAFDEKRFKETQALREKQFQVTSGQREQEMTQNYQQNLQRMQFENQLGQQGRQFQYGQAQDQFEYGKSGMKTANWLNLAGVGVGGLTGYAKMMQDLKTGQYLRGEKPYGV